MTNKLSREGAAKLFGALLLGMGLVFGLVLSPVALHASNLRQIQPPPSIITIPAGGTATLTARGFCLDFGKPFPTGDTSTNAVAADKIRAALNYSIQKGYTEGNAQQVQLAIWYLRDNTWHAEQHTVADEIVREATAANMPPAAGDAVSLSDAVAQNKVTVTAKFVPQTTDAYYGDGPVQIKNLGTADIRIYLAIGSTFTQGPTGTFQDLAAYELSLQQGTTTPVLSATPATTQQPTIQPTLTAITTPITGTATTTTTVVPGTAEPTGTVAATTTVAATRTVAGTAQATTTTAATVEATATTAVETPTVEATATTATEAPTATATPEGSPLPATGRQDGNAISWITFIVGIGLFFIALGAVLKRQRNLS